MIKFEKLKLDHLSLAFLHTSKLKMFGPLDRNLVLPLALKTLNPQHQLLGSLGLLPQDGFGLTSKSLLFTIIPTSSLGLLGLSRFLVLDHLELLVCHALGVGAVGSSHFRYIHHDEVLDCLL